MSTRAYSLITITKADEERREISGVASTPETDLAGDIVEPLGAQWKKPVDLPLLNAHSHLEPVGRVFWLEARADGIHFKARFARVAEPGPLRDRLETAWGSVKAGLIKALSIGFLPVQSEPIRTGTRYLKWLLNEISIVAVGANQSATIQQVKRLDAEARIAAELGYQPAIRPPAADVAKRKVQLATATLPVLDTKNLSELAAIAGWGKIIDPLMADYPERYKDARQRMKEIAGQSSGDPLLGVATYQEAQANVMTAVIKHLLVRIDDLEQARTPTSTGQSITAGGSAKTIRTRKDGSGNLIAEVYDAGLKSEMAAIEARLARLEQGAGGFAKYCGVWRSDQTYRQGDMTTHAGSVWHCNRETRDRPGDGAPSWVLAVKGGGR